MGIIFIYYGPSITNMREASLAKEIAGVMCVLDDNVRACIVDGKGASRVTHFEYFKGLMRIEDCYAEAAIEVWNITGTSKDLVVNISFVLGSFEYELSSTSTMLPENSTRYVRGDWTNFINDTSFTKDLGRVTIHKWGLYYIRLDYRVRVYNWTEGETVRILFRIINVTRISQEVGAGPPSVNIYTENLDTLSYLVYGREAKRACTFLIKAKYRPYWARNVIVEYPLRLQISAGYSVRLETLTTIIGARLLT